LQRGAHSNIIVNNQDHGAVKLKEPVIDKAYENFDD
jgi:hypothetical protein